jgi:hypothetical protein
MFLSLAPDVEERVVDPDREPDQQDDGVRRVVRGPDLARESEQAEGSEHGGQCEKQWDARGDERSERNQQDRQRQRDREVLGPPEVVPLGVVERLGRTGVAELAHVEAGVTSGSGLHGREDPLDLGGAPAEAWTRAEWPSFVCVALWTRTLRVAPVEPALRIDPRRPARLAGLCVRVRELLGADEAAQHEGDRHEGQPAEDRDLAVAGAPAPIRAARLFDLPIPFMAPLSLVSELRGSTRASGSGFQPRPRDS